MRYVQEELGLPNGRVLQTLATERRALVLCCDRYGYKTFVMRMDRNGDRWLVSDATLRGSMPTTSKKEKLLDELPKNVAAALLQMKMEKDGWREKNPANHFRPISTAQDS